MRLRYWFLLVLALFLLPESVQAQAPDPKQQQLLIPPEVDAPTVVYVDVSIDDLFSIDEKGQSYKVDAILYLSWFDGRLAFDANTFGYDSKTYQDEAVGEALKSEIWWPGVTIVDSREPRNRLNTTLTVFDNGDVEYVERFTATIHQPFDLEDFPFDEHEIAFQLQPFAYTAYDVVFEQADSPYNEAWETEEWDVAYQPLQIEIPDMTDENRVYDYATVTAVLEIARVPNFYVSNFILPLVLIVAISWAVFWMNYGDMHLADRMSVSFTGVLTIVAFDFVSSDTLPKLSYATFLDNVLTLSYIFLSLTVLENVLSYWLVRKHDDDEAAQKIDRPARYLFPIGYTLIMLVLFIGTA